MNSIENVKSFKKGKNFSLYLITGVISSVLFLIFCAMMQIYPFGERMINDVDLMEQSLPIYYHVWDALHGRAALTYDWNFALGMNFTGVFAHFSIINPFTLLFFLTPRRYLQKFIVFYVTFKIACTGISMCAFLLHDRLLIRRRLPAPYLIIASVGYALSGYAIQYFGYSWIEVSFFAPLVMLMLNNMLLERESLRITWYDLGYTAFLAMILAMNIPIAFPVCLYLLFYAAGYCLICIKDRAETTRIAFKFVTLSLLALGVSAVVFYPSFHELLQSYRIAIAQTFGVKEYFETLDDRGMEPWRKYFMMKTLVLPLAIEAACLIFKAVKKLFHRQDFFLLYINLLIIAPVYFETTNHVWHNGGYVCFPMRYGFMLVFTVIAGSYVLLSEILTEQGLFTELPENKVTMISYALMLLWLGIICVLDPGELGYRDEEEDAVVLSDRIEEIIPAPEVKIERMKNADASLHNSYSMILGRPAFGNYIPLTTSDHIIADDMMGYSQDWERMSDAGGTMFSDTLLQLNTTICKEDGINQWLTDHTGSDLYEYKGSLDSYALYERTTRYPYALFIKDLEGKRLSWELADNTYVNQNVLSELFFDEALFTDYEEDFLLAGGESKTFPIEVSGKQAVYVYTDDLIRMSVDLNGETIMETYPQNLYNGLICLGLYEDETIYLTLKSKGEEDQNGELFVGFMDLEKYLKTVEVSDKDLVINHFETGKKGAQIEVTAAQDGYVFMPIYCDDGWSFFVDGIRTTPETFHNFFFLIPVHKGTNTIQMSFRTRKLISGFIITIISLLCIAVLYIFTGMEKRPVIVDKALTFGSTAARYLLILTFAGAVIVVYVIPIFWQLFMWR